MILWHVDPLLGNDLKYETIRQPLLSNGYASEHVSMATIALK
jgi:hypothetical protein